VKGSQYLILKKRAIEKVEERGPGSLGRSLIRLGKRRRPEGDLLGRTIKRTSVHSVLEGFWGWWKKAKRRGFKPT